MPKRNPPPVKPTPAALEQLKPHVAERVQEQAAHSQAVQERITAETAFLEQMIRLVSPALEGMSYGITLEYERHRNEYDATRDRAPPPPTELTTAFEILGEPVRGFHVEGVRVPVRVPLHALKGELRGEGLWLCADGRLLELDFRGTFDTALARDMEWKATATFLTPREAVESGWSAEAIFNAVRNAVLAMKRGRATERQQKQAEKMFAIVQAVAELLKQHEDPSEGSGASRRTRRR